MAVIAACVSSGISGAGAQAAERAVALRIVRRRIERADTTVRFDKGDWIELRWTTDEATTIHVHGYDLQLVLEPGAEKRMRFVADATGRFPVSAHGFGADTRGGTRREVVLLYLEVLPH